jgi:hypothetical protein
VLRSRSPEISGNHVVAIVAEAVVEVTEEADSISTTKIEAEAGNSNGINSKTNSLKLDFLLF